MNTEDFVTYEQAVKLKELGFDWEVNHCYYDDELNEICDGSTSNYDNCNSTDYIERVCSAPTLSQAQKWLRNVKKADIIVTLEDETDDPYQVEVYINKVCVSGHWRHGFFTDFDEALSVGISKALELLINKS